MALPFRPRSIPLCSACVRSYDASIPPTALRQQIRGKKKMANEGSTVPVRLLKNVKTFGKKGRYMSC